jgi:hypothetical protein
VGRIRESPEIEHGQGLSGPAKAELSLAQAAAAVMPPLDWARPATPEELAEAEADGWDPETAGVAGD